MTALEQINEIAEQNKQLYYNNEKLLQLISEILKLNKDKQIDKLIKDYLVNNKCI
jgi:replication-associated recombination protein RarA